MDLSHNSPEAECRGTINGLLNTLERLQQIEGANDRKRMIEIFFRRRRIREKLIRLVNLHLHSQNTALCEAAELAEKYLEGDDQGFVSPLHFDLAQLHKDLQLTQALLPPSEGFLRNRIQEYYDEDTNDW